jgi:hypothetical protein
VSLGFIPLQARALTYFSHGFTIYLGEDTEDDHSRVSVDTIHAALTVHHAEDVRLYEDRWGQLQRMAVFDEQARQHIGALAEQFQEAVV